MHKTNDAVPMKNDTEKGNEHKVLLTQINWDELFFYQKSDVLYQLTFAFCKRFLPQYGDRTVDQMVQAARSGKQNIVEGLADGVTSTEMQLKLLNVGRSSLQELQRDFADYLNTRQLQTWSVEHPRYDGMLKFCRKHNKPADYEPYFYKWGDEEMANIGLTLCHMTDKMMTTFLQKLEKDFVENGGIKERMYKARTGYRKEQDERMHKLESENACLKRKLARLREILDKAGIKY